MFKIKVSQNETGEIPTARLPQHTLSMTPGEPSCSRVYSKTRGPTSSTTNVTEETGASSLLRTAHSQEHYPSCLSRADGGELFLESGSVWKHEGVFLSWPTFPEQALCAPSNVPHATAHPSYLRVRGRPPPHSREVLNATRLPSLYAPRPP